MANPDKRGKAKDILVVTSCCGLVGAAAPGHFLAKLSQHTSNAWWVPLVLGQFLILAGIFAILASQMRLLWDVIIRNELDRRLQGENARFEQTACMTTWFCLIIAIASPHAKLALLAAVQASLFFALLRWAHDPQALRSYIQQYAPSPVSSTPEEASASIAHSWLSPLLLGFFSADFRGGEVDALCGLAWSQVGESLVLLAADASVLPMWRFVFLETANAAGVGAALCLLGLGFQWAFKLFAVLLVKLDIDMRHGHGSAKLLMLSVKSLPMLAGISLFGPPAVSLLAAAAFAGAFLLLRSMHNMSRLEQYLDRLILIKSSS